MILLIQMFVEIAHHQTFNFVDQLKKRNLRKIGIQKNIHETTVFFSFSLYQILCSIHPLYICST